MIEREFTTISKELEKRRYARKFIVRITGELTDHYETLIDEYLEIGMDREAAFKMASEKIGEDTEILQRILRQKELQPFVMKHPIISFLVMPFAAFVLGVFSLVAIPIMLFSDTLDRLSPQELLQSGFIEIMVTLTSVVAYGLPILISIGFCWLAQYYRIKLAWLASSAAIISMLGSTLVFEIIYPEGHPNFRFDPTLDNETLNRGALVLNGGFWNDAGVNLVGLLAPIILFAVFSLYPKNIGE